MKRALMVLLCVFVCAPLLAQPKGTPPSRPEVAAEDWQPLPRPLKIQFRFEPQGADDKPFWVIASTTRYGIHLSFEGKGSEFQARIIGRIRPHEDKYLLTYDAQVRFVTQEGSAFFAGEGSAQLAPGKEKMLTLLGDRGLVVLMSFDE